MPQQDIQKLDSDPSLGVLENPKGFSGKIKQEKAYEILSKGLVFTMEDDLKEAMNSQRMKADLIPGKAGLGFGQTNQNETKTQDIFPQEAHFDPFKDLQQKVLERQQKEEPVVAPVAPEKTIIQTDKEPLVQSTEPVVEKNIEPTLPIKPSVSSVPLASPVAAPISSEDLPEKLKELISPPISIPKAQILVDKKELLKSDLINQEIGVVKIQSKTNQTLIDLIKSTSFPKVKQELQELFLKISQDVKHLEMEKAPFLQKREEILEKIKQQRIKTDILFQNVQSIQEQQEKIEQEEQKIQDFQQKRTLEEQRWQVEEKQKQAEELKWASEEELEKVQMVLAKIDSNLLDIKNKKETFEKKQRDIEKFLNSANLLKNKDLFLEKNQDKFKQKQEIQSQYQDLLAQKNKLETDFSLITQQEGIVEEKFRGLEKQIQQVLDFRERRKLEQERWQISQERRLKEKNRWDIEQLLAQAKQKTSSLEEKVSQFKKEEEAKSQKINEIEAQIGELTVLPEIEKYLLPITQTPKQEQENKTETLTFKNEDKQKSIEELPVVLSERLAAKPQQELPKETDFVVPVVKESTQNKTIAQQLEERSKEQEAIQKQVVEKQIQEQEKSINVELLSHQEDENRQKAIQKIKQIAEQEQKKASLIKLKGPLLKEEILKKLTKISPQEEVQRKNFLSRISNAAKPVLPRLKTKNFEEGVVFHPMIKKTSLAEKIVIRSLFIVLLLGFLIGCYFLIIPLVKKDRLVKPPIESVGNQAVISPTTTSEEWPDIFNQNIATTTATSSADQLPQSTTTKPIATTTNPVATTTQPAQTPIALFNVAKTNIFSFQGDLSPLLSSVETVLKTKIQYGKFEQIAVFDETSQRFLTAGEFFGTLQTILPQEILQETGASFVLVFSSKYGNRLGFALSTENATATYQAFLDWESQAEANTASLFDLMGKTSPSLIKIFKTLRYKAVLMRCQTFTKSDLGICYAIHKKYFIFTSSFEQMARIVDRLP